MIILPLPVMVLKKIVHRVGRKSRKKQLPNNTYYAIMLRPTKTILVWTLEAAN